MGLAVKKGKKYEPVKQKLATEVQGYDAVRMKNLLNAQRLFTASGSGPGTTFYTTPQGKIFLITFMELQADLASGSSLAIPEINTFLLSLNPGENEQESFNENPIILASGQSLRVSTGATTIVRGYEISA